MDNWAKSCDLVQEYNVLFKPEEYNNFFHPNICHVCKRSNNGNLISCNMCCMVYYCNDKHRRAHYIQHKELCEHLTQFLREKREWGNIRYSHSEWVQDRKEFLDTIETYLLRKLKPYEKQIIIFAKSCIHCHQQNNLNYCLECYSENYCIEHLQEFKDQHTSKCEVLKSCINLDIRYLSFGSFTNNFPSVNVTLLSNDMKEFIIQFVRHSTLKAIEYWAFDDYYYSDYVSNPLTLYYGLNATDLLNSSTTGCVYVIHVIAANYLDLLYVKAWELFLHCFHRIQELIVIVVGPELEIKSSDVKLCEHCQLHKKMFNFESYSMSYANYIYNDSYKQPNVIMGIHVDFSNEKTSLTFMLKSRNNNNNIYPWLLTTKSKDIARLNMEIMEEFLGIPVKSIHSVKNKFASFKPWRDFETSYVSYRNKYVTIYDYLPLSQ
ncbi:uncharacterized protein LOC116847620 [Odontomachus brunneus]|uniref:uncharacterized protein LOC116847620 n=1 Tax=Odontomachus brunneus TaxID=486640 RepID=UPI0013F22EB5|nr:uncharacterized protein LOC116847620 [Odontomachus brunneus]